MGEVAAELLKMLINMEDVQASLQNMHIYCIYCIYPIDFVPAPHFFPDMCYPRRVKFRRPPGVGVYLYGCAGGGAGGGSKGGAGLVSPDDVPRDVEAACKQRTLLR